METIKAELHMETTLSPGSVLNIEEVWAVMGEHGRPGGRVFIDLTDVPGLRELLLDAYADRLRSEMKQRAEHDKAAVEDAFKER